MLYAAITSPAGNVGKGVVRICQLFFHLIDTLIDDVFFQRHAFHFGKLATDSTVVKAQSPLKLNQQSAVRRSDC
jgi:hypothetical protein